MNARAHSRQQIYQLLREIRSSIFKKNVLGFIALIIIAIGYEWRLAMGWPIIFLIVVFAFSLSRSFHYLLLTLFLRKGTGYLAKHQVWLSSDQMKQLSEVSILLLPPLFLTNRSLSNVLSQLTVMGVRFLIVTSQPLTARSDILKGKGEFLGNKIITGQSIDQMSDSELDFVLQARKIFAQLEPRHKSRIISRLNISGEHIGFWPESLQELESSVFQKVLLLGNLNHKMMTDSHQVTSSNAGKLSKVLLGKEDLSTLTLGILAAKQAVNLSYKAIRQHDALSLAQILAVMVGGIFLPFLPITAEQCLIQLIIFLVAQGLLPFERPTISSLFAFSLWNKKKNGSLVWSLVVVGLIFNLMCFIVLWMVFKANTSSHKEVFQTGWFVASLMAQIILMYTLRSHGIRLMNVLFSWGVLPHLVAILSLVLFLPEVSWLHSLGFHHLPNFYYGYLLILLALCFVLVQIVKEVFVRQYIK